MGGKWQSVEAEGSASCREFIVHWQYCYIMRRWNWVELWAKSEKNRFYLCENYNGVWLTSLRKYRRYFNQY